VLISTLGSFLIFLLGACSVGSLLMAAFYPRIAATSALDRQVEMISGGSMAAAPGKVLTRAREEPRLFALYAQTAPFTYQYRPASSRR
jgi:hypothetical protein